MLVCSKVATRHSSRYPNLRTTAEVVPATVLKRSTLDVVAVGDFPGAEGGLDVNNMRTLRDDVRHQ